MLERRHLWASLLLLGMPANFAIANEVPPDIAVASETVVLQAHAVGAQIYECKKGENGSLNWAFREPIASLFENGKTVGRHYAGPSWEVGHSIIRGKTIAQAPGATDQDIPWLKLKVADNLGDPDGPLEEVDMVQRINTQGGNLQGPCDKAGDLQAQPYSADYVFLKK
jgi:hypothetical protein